MTNQKQDENKNAGNKIRKGIVELFLKGKTIEEIQQMSEYKELTQETLERIRQKNMARIMAFRLVPIKQIASILNFNEKYVYENIKSINVNGKSILELRNEKAKIVKSRLENGESIEDLLNDRDLNVSIEGINYVKNKIEKSKDSSEKKNRENRENDKKITKTYETKITQLYLKGMTTDEILSKEEYKGLQKEYLEKIKESNMIGILAIRLVPVDDIANRLKIHKSTVYYNLKKININGESILQIIKRKQEEVVERLRTGESIESLLGDRKLNVSIEGIERVKSLKKNNNNKKKTKIVSNITKVKSNIQTKSDIQEKIKIVKEKYWNISQKPAKTQVARLDNKSLFIEDKEISEQIDSILSNLRKNDKRNREFVPTIKDILKKAITLSNSKQQLSINQIQKIISILKDEKINYSFKYFSEYSVNIIKKTIKNMYIRLTNAINEKADVTTDLNQLEQLYKLIPYNMEEKDYSINIVREKLIRKIQNLKNEKVMKGINYQSPKEIQEIARNIASGILDVETTSEKLKKKAESEYKKSKDNKFKLTKEQRLKQFYSQIGSELKNSSIKYNIIDPEKTIGLLNNLTGMEITNILNIVVTNLINRGKFDEATKLCEQYFTKVNDNTKVIYLNNLLKQIKNAKLGNMIHRLINSNLSSKEEENIWSLIQKDIEVRNVKMSNVIIEKNKDGSRAITLQDIWPEEKTFTK